MTQPGDAEGRMHYLITCPRCAGEIRHVVKPRWGDPGFLVEFQREIRLVAFDLLLYHLQDAHPEPAEAYRAWRRSSAATCRRSCTT